MHAIGRNASLFIIAVQYHVSGRRIAAQARKYIDVDATDTGQKRTHIRDPLSIIQKDVKVQPAPEELVQGAFKALPHQAPPASGQTYIFKNDVPSKIASSWTNPVALGLVLGLLLIGPDHLGTLMALSTLTSGMESFKVGFGWGFGHSLGMIVIVPLFLLMKRFSSKKFDMEQWEYLGDYLIGVSMVLVAAYFIVYESKYLEKRKDGTFEIKPCKCHGSTKAQAQSTTCPPSRVEGGTESQPQHSPKFCSKYSEAECMIECKKNAKRKTGHKSHRSIPAVDGGSIPTVEECIAALEESFVEDALQRTEASDNSADETAAGAMWLNKFCTARDVQGAMLGALQGLCCPMGLASLGFIGRVGTNSSPMMLFLFSVVFVFASALGSGAITFGWGALTTSGSGKWLSPQVVYRTSCIATCLLGFLWIVANACGVLEQINFAESKIHENMHQFHEASKH